jgi:Na+/pantothenate symporter
MRDNRTNARRLIIGAAVVLILLVGVFTIGLMGWWMVILIVALGLLAGGLITRRRGPPAP